ncbi:MAG: PBSX family phage terminase large subunit [Clostridiales bacterium]|nr:PBSX family phage terminase large subunit [Clostridiales bacterium]
MTLSELSPKQKTVLKWAFTPSTRDRYRAIICDGAVRSGKTVCMLTAFILWAMRYFNGQSFGICGKTVASAERNIVRPAQEQADLQAYFSLIYRRADHVLMVHGLGRENRFYIFGGKDESSYALIQGITLCGVLFDEVALMPRSFVEQAIARTLSEPDARLWFNCNPEGPGHWFYQEWVKDGQPEAHRALRLHFRMEDNPILTPEQIAEAETVYQGVFRDRYILGLWVAAEGRVYDMFDQSRNVAAALPELAGDCYVSCDYGTQNPTVFLLWRRERGGERWFCVREYYYSGREKRRQKTDSEFADDLAAWLGEDRPRAVVVDPSAASFIAELRQRGWAVQKADNDVLDGIRDVARRLGAGELLFHRSCAHTLEEFQAYVWDEKAGERGEDRPVKASDHCMDAMRYFVSTILGRQIVSVKRRPRGI